MKKCLSCVAILCVVILTTNVMSNAETVICGSFPIPQMVEDAEHGLFIELTKAIAERSGLDIEIQVVPAKRASVYFQEGDIHVLFPAVDRKFPPDQLPNRSKEAIFSKKTYIFTRKDSPVFKSVQELEGKRVGVTRGYAYPEELLSNPKILLDEANNDEASAKKLLAGRIDAFVVEEQSGLNAFNASGAMDGVHYDAESPVEVEDVYYAFQRTDEGAALAERFSNALSDMKQDGSFKKILGGGQ